MIKIRDLAEEVCHSLDIRDPVASGGPLDGMTLEQWVLGNGGGKTGLASAVVWTRAMLGLEPKDVSALFFLNYCSSGGGLLQMRSDRRNGGQYLRIVEGKFGFRGLPVANCTGTQALSQGLAARLAPNSVTLSNPVRYIEQTSTGVIVHAAKGRYLCKRVIVSIPTPLYKDITFNPPLPTDKAEMSQANKLGFLNKVAVRYRTPWWRDAGLTGMLQSFTGPVSVTRDISVDEKGLYALTCFLAGDAGRASSKLSKQERFKQVTDQIQATLGKAAGIKVPEPVGIDEHEWWHDMWSQGCPCPTAPPGAMTKYEHALRSTHGRVYFVGTELAWEWKGYLEGAIRSGKRGAKDVLNAMKLSKL